jgi:hypothetical protein
MRVPQFGQNAQDFRRPLSQTTSKIFGLPREQLEGAGGDREAHAERAAGLALAFSAMADGQLERLALEPVSNLAALAAADRCIGHVILPEVVREPVDTSHASRGQAAPATMASGSLPGGVLS